MNWDRIQTDGLSCEKAFEMLCNQLFENWCKEEYSTQLSHFHVINGSGGDGGVESIAVLKDNSIIGLQAKWFRSSIDSSRISQIRNSLKTAMNVRPEITQYIVCIPRDLASITARGKTSERSRWESFLCEIKTAFPNLKIELWDDSRITSEMQKPKAEGINKFWFSNSEMGYEKIRYAFEKAKTGWLSTKYEPDLNSTGRISDLLKRYVGDFSSRRNLSEEFESIISLSQQFIIEANCIISSCDEKDSDLINCLQTAKKDVQNVKSECEKIKCWLIDEAFERPIYEMKLFQVSFGSIKDQIKDSVKSFEKFLGVLNILKILNELSKVEFHSMLSKADDNINSKCILFLGNPGTGKTHGVSAFAESILNSRYHIPIIIPARDVPESYNWKDIIISTLNLAATWNEAELWQALISSVNKNRFQEEYITERITILPKVLVIIDGIDESATHEKWIERIKETSTISKAYPQICFCFTSRPAVFSSSINYAYVNHLNEAGDVPAFKLFDRYIEAYGIGLQNSQWLKYALNTPLSLKLFCELYKGRHDVCVGVPDVSMNQLWRKKIEQVQSEYDKKEGNLPRNQNVLKSIVVLAKQFLQMRRIDRTILLEALKEENEFTDSTAATIIDLFEKYGIVGSVCEKGSGLQPDRFIYYSGIQGYFDYASAEYLIEQYKNPSQIDFEKCNNVDINTLYCLSIISIQRFGYLLTRNTTIRECINTVALIELQYYSLQNTDNETAQRFVDSCLKNMRHSAEQVSVIVNKLVLPLSRMTGHPLGVNLLDSFLNEFDKPAQRDIIWSLPPTLFKSANKRWYKNEPIDILYEEIEEYHLTSNEKPDGLPLVYAWMLSSVDNRARKYCRDRLMVWAIYCPQEFYSLFLHFSSVNDPQVKSDLFSILMCVVFEYDENSYTKDVSSWILHNILDPSVIDKNRDISIRYYSISIIKKAVASGLFSVEEVRDFLPPYNVENNMIELNKEAMSGTRMGGYSAIDYDLSRYVLIDRFESWFNSFPQRQLDALVNSLAKTHSDYSEMTSEQFILSAAYAFILQMGWNEKEFYNREKDESGHYIGGVDCSIRGSYRSADHGEQSEVMTVCEKYVWQARNSISGFLCDRLLFSYEQIQVVDYSLLDDFIVPIQEVYQIDPDNIPDDRPWYIPELSKVDVDKEFASKKEVSEYIKHADDINWEKWIRVKNDNSSYAIPSSKLLALKMFACFKDYSAINTLLFINSIVVPTDEIELFVDSIQNDNDPCTVCDPTKWDGGIESSCYITPREVCWFSEKPHYDSHLKERFPSISIQSAVDGCCYNYPEYGDVYYYMPSSLLRNLLGVVDTNGYKYINKSDNVVSEYSIVGRKWETEQNYVLVDEANTLNTLKENGLSLVWIMQELREESDELSAKFDGYRFEKRQYYVGYFKEDGFVSKKISESLWDGNS
ncbi:MAG: hypothetical protein IJT44_12825 [Clostridia bacterium]|nr:hypothetical protein [Clostridia bacterium]